MCRDDLRKLFLNLNKQKNKLKKMGIRVDGKHYNIRFKGKLLPIFSYIIDDMVQRFRITLRFNMIKINPIIHSLYLRVARSEV